MEESASTAATTRQGATATTARRATTETCPSRSHTAKPAKVQCWYTALDTLSVCDQSYVKHRNGREENVPHSSSKHDEGITRTSLGGVTGSRGSRQSFIPEPVSPSSPSISRDALGVCWDCGGHGGMGGSSWVCLHRQSSYLASFSGWEAGVWGGGLLRE